MKGKLLALFASPRREGNSAALLETVLPVFEAAGFAVDRCHPHGLSIAPCLGCQVCERSGSCIACDDMDALVHRLDEASALIVATPVYFYGLPAGAKAMVDRCQTLWARRHRPRSGNARPDRPAYWLAVAASRGPRLFDGIDLTLRYFFDAAGFTSRGSLAFRGVDKAGDFAADPIRSQRARRWAEEVLGAMDW